MREEYPFDITVVMAVYNVERYLYEAVDSVIEQDLGFDKIQLIMVDDGSTDGSGAICDEYASKWPGNITVIHKENGGASSARNAGLPHVKGKYLNFMDPDDRMGPETMRLAAAFFEEHGEETDIVSVPMYYFDGKTGQHALNYKYEEGTRIIDLEKYPSMFQLSLPSSFCRSEAFRGITFDTRLSYAEDGKCALRLLLKKRTLGVIKEAAYYYRRRTTGVLSAIQNCARSPQWFLPKMSFFFEEILRECREQFGEIPAFIQHALAYDLEWHVKEEQFYPGVLTENEQEEYLNRIKGVLAQLDDEVILQQKYLSDAFKLFLLGKKHGRKPELIEEDDDITVLFGERPLFSVSNCVFQLCSWKETSESHIIEMEALILPSLANIIMFWIGVNGQAIPCRLVDMAPATVSLGETVQFRLSLSAEFLCTGEGNTLEISFLAGLAGGKPVSLVNLKCGERFPLSMKLENSYYWRGDHVLFHKGQALYYEPCSRRKKRKHERALWRELLKEKIHGGRKAFAVRVALQWIMLLKHKPLWLIIDGENEPTNNGKLLFGFLRAEHPEIDVRYVIRGDDPDFNRITRIGPIIRANSGWYKLMLLLSDCVIIGEAREETPGPFGKNNDPYRDYLSNLNYFFLRPGITEADFFESVPKKS